MSGETAKRLIELMPVALYDWQKEFVLGAFADDVILAGLSTARASGKSFLISAIVTAYLQMPGKRVVMVAAASHDQAREAVFNPFIELAGASGLFADWNMSNNRTYAGIESPDGQKSFRVMTAEARTSHGRRPSLVIVDEPAQFKSDDAGERMLAAQVSGLGKQDDARLIVIGTLPAYPDHFFANYLENQADYAMVCKADLEKHNRYSRAAWRQANPSAKYLPTLEKVIAKQALDAQRDSSMRAIWNSLRLNLGCADVVELVALDAERLAEIETDRVHKGSGLMIWGVDTATTEMAAVSCIYADTGDIESVAAFPQNPGLAERGKSDAVGGLYEQCHNDGDLEICGEDVIDLVILLQIAVDRFGGVPAMVICDSWREAELKQSLRRMGMTPQVMSRRKGTFTGSEDYRDFKRTALEKRIRILRQRITRHAFAEARLVQDDQGNQYLSRNAKRKRGHDDVVSAMILAVAWWRRWMDAKASRPIGDDDFVPVEVVSGQRFSWA